MLSDRLDVDIAKSLARYATKQGLDQLIQGKSSVTEGLKKRISGPMIGGHLPAGCSPADRKKLALSLDVIIDYAKLYGFRSDSFDRSSTLMHWQLCSVECGWIKFLKYKLAAFMSHHLGGTLPEKPFSVEDHPNQIAGSTLGRFFRLIAETPQARSFAVGILYSKKGMPRPDSDALEQAIVSTKKVLTSIKPTPLSRFSSKPLIGTEIRRTCMEVFTSRIRDSDLHHPYAPSIKANYVDSRSKFGTLGTLMDDAFLMDRFAPNKARELYSNALVEDIDVDEITDESTVHIKVRPAFKKLVEDVYREVYTNVRSRAGDEEANVKLVALPEALKVRVISKGPPLTYFSLKPVQKFLLRQMRRLRAFKLVGETVTPEFLLEVFSGSSGKFHSLDYQSATDLLDPELSGVAVDGICDAVGMPEDIRVLFHKALTGHLVEDVPQVWGQLMGSVVSFIILCIVNMAVIRHAYEIEHSCVISLREIPAVVNGDDGLVRSTDQFAVIWESIARVAGLIPSVGKVYSHSIYCNINSTSYEYKSGRFVLIPYPNMGLVMGLGRSGGKVDIGVATLESENPFVKSIGARHHALLESCPESMQMQVHELFLLHNAGTLKLTRVPWYVPESLGGVGLKPLIVYDYGDGDVDNLKKSYARTSTGHVCGPSRLDVVICWGLLSRTYRSISVKKVPSSQPIQARPVWQQHVRETFSLRADAVMSLEDESFMDMSTYYLTPSAVAVELGASTRMEVIRRNERAWTSLLDLNTDFSSRGVDLFLESGEGIRRTKGVGVKPFRLLGADPISHRPIYGRA